MTFEERVIDRERLLVIDNIERAIEDGDSFRKVEIGDPLVTEEMRKRAILPFDIERKKPINKLLSFIARRIAERETKKINSETEIVGLENLASVDGGAIITANHFNPMDNTVIRHLAMKCGKGKKLSIMVQESNIFMKGFFGFLMRNCKTVPVSSDSGYLARCLKPAIKGMLERGEWLLIYPEAEMWFNYKKPRPHKEGAYYYAEEFDVPVIPTFIEQREIDGFDGSGLRRVKYILHVMPPIYPDKALGKRERRRKMLDEDLRLKADCYERAYGIKLTEDFLPERDIAGYWE